jgi:hypothetical protein
MVSTTGTLFRGYENEKSRHDKTNNNNCKKFRRKPRRGYVVHSSVSVSKRAENYMQRTGD